MTHAVFANDQGVSTRFEWMRLLYVRRRRNEDNCIDMLSGLPPGKVTAHERCTMESKATHANTC
jgi:hypothetical protein